MKSKTLIMLIVAFILSFLITTVVRSTFKREKDFMDNEHQNPSLYTKLNVTFTPKATQQPTPTISPTPLPTYNPNEVFFDDFNRQDLNICYWNKVERENNYNDELQLYVKENVFIENGCLVLLAENNNNEYTSGLVNTKSKIEFKYGTISVRLKYPSGRSFFPAIWLLPADNSAYPEIDILEVVGHRPSTIYFVYHYYSEEKRTTGNKIKLEDYDEFHTYSLTWTPESLTWYVDNVQVYKLSRNLPTKPMYLIINFAVGGVWPGDPDENTIFPSKVLIDYVEIIPYQLISEET